MAKDEGEAGDAGAEAKEPPARPPRMECPFCGSSRTQPFTHAGPAARNNMRCLDCGHQFKDRELRR